MKKESRLEQFRDEESVPEIFRLFDFCAIFEPPQTRGTRISETTVEILHFAIGSV
jgi:hypothetical protein